jgi:HSP20 family protein
MERLRREMNRMFSGWPSQTGWNTAAGYPAMNVWADKDNAVVSAELPGVDPDAISISVENDTLTLSGSRERADIGEAKYHRAERRFGKFSRAFRLPFQVESEKVEASFDNGVLNIHLPRAEADKPRRIEIKAG